jgi:hypothetical protein
MMRLATDVAVCALGFGWYLCTGSWWPYLLIGVFALVETAASVHRLRRSATRKS